MGKSGTLLFGDEAVVIFRRHMDCEFVCALARPDCLSHAADMLDLDLSLCALLVDVVDLVGRDSECPLLRPVEHVCLLHFARIHQRFYSQSSDCQPGKSQICQILALHTYHLQ